MSLDGVVVILETINVLSGSRLNQSSLIAKQSLEYPGIMNRRKLTCWQFECIQFRIMTICEVGPGDTNVRKCSVGENMIWYLSLNYIYINNIHNLQILIQTFMFLLEISFENLLIFSIVSSVSSLDYYFLCPHMWSILWRRFRILSCLFWTLPN